MTKYLLISLGAILGANARYLVQTWFADHGWAAFPLGTLVINVSGSFILAFFVTLTTERVLADPNLRFLVAVGFCGAYTTFSSLTYETWTVFNTGGWWPAAVNLVGTMALGVLATLAGVLLARAL